MEYCPTTHFQRNLDLVIFSKNKYYIIQKYILISRVRIFNMIRDRPNYAKEFFSSINKIDFNI